MVPYGILRVNKQPKIYYRINDKNYKLPPKIYSPYY